MFSFSTKELPLCRIMKTRLKKYYSLFFVLLFLYPMVEKEFHAFEHQNDTHCAAADKHFHALEHSCSICDYTVIKLSSSIPCDVEFIISESVFSFLPYGTNEPVVSSFAHLPSRAPPFVCF